MTDATSRQIPPPRNWQDFEDLCHDLFAAMWRDDYAQRHGRHGQRQQGVDIFGTDRQGGGHVGVQCKGKDVHFGQPVRVDELRREVELAKDFHPPLRVFVLATTTRNDQAIQADARRLTYLHRAQGLFDVHVFGWDEILTRLRRHPHVLETHYPDLATTLPALLQRGADSVVDTLERRFGLVSADLQTPRPRPVTPLDAPPSAPTTALQAKIDLLAELIRTRHPRTGLVELQRLWDEQAASAPAADRLRMKSAIGTAHRLLGDDGDAATALREAHAEEPNSAAGHAALAFAHLCEADRPEAFAHAKRALEIDPSSERAAAIVIDAAPSSLGIQALSAALPAPHLRNARLLARLANVADEMEACGEADRLAADALRRGQDEWSVQAQVGLLHFNRAARNASVLGRGQADGSVRADLDEAVDRFDRAWAELRDTEWPGRGDWIARNLVLALRHRGDLERSDDVLDDAMRACPSSPDLLRIAAIRAFDHGDDARARRCIEDIPAVRRGPADELALCHARILSGDAQAALERLRDRDLAHLPDAHARDVAALRIIAGDAVDAATRQAEITGALAAFPDDVLVLATALLHLPQDAVERDDLAERLARRAPASSETHARDHAARALLACGRDGAAADLLAGLHPLDRATPTLRTRLRALLRAGRAGDARALLSELDPDLPRQDAELARLAAATFEAVGRLPEARAHYATVLASPKATVEDRIKWIQLCERIPDRAPAEAYLQNMPGDVAGDALELMALAHACDRLLAGPCKALRLAYRAVRVGGADHDVLLGHAFLLFLGRVTAHPLPHHDVVEPDAAVSLRVEAGPSLVRIIETEPDPIAERDEIAPDDALARRLLDKRVGDRVELDGLGPGPRRAEITAIESKYLVAHRRVLERFTALFPESPALSVYHFDEDGIEDGLRPLLDAHADRRRFDLEVERAYAAGHLPLPIYARLRHRTPLDLWEEIRADDERRFHLALGTPDELEEALDVLAPAPPLVIDPMTLYAHHRLGLAELAIDAAPNGIVVAQSGLDLIWESRHYHPRRDVEDRADAVHRFAASALHVAAPERPTPLEHSASLQLETAHRCFCETLRLAKERDAVLLTDDLALRRISAAEGIPSVWSQPVFLHAMRAGRISAVRHARATATLVESAHHFVSVDANAVIAAWLERDLATLQRLVAQIASPDNEPDSIVGLLAEIFVQLPFEPDPQPAAALLVVLVDGFRERDALERGRTLMWRAFARSAPERKARAMRASFKSALRHAPIDLSPAAVAERIEDQAVAPLEGALNGCLDAATAGNDATAVPGGEDDPPAPATAGAADAPAESRRPRRRRRSRRRRARSR